MKIITNLPMSLTRFNKLLGCVLILLLSLLIWTYKTPPLALSATNHVVISEVQISGTTATDEFVEIYNPTSQTIDLSGWRLTRRTSGGTQANLVASLSGTIAANGFLLIAHPDYDGSVSADIAYSSTSSAVAANNTVTLYSDAGLTIVDLVGMGTASFVESTSAAVPATNQSIERKATSISTPESLTSGGTEETAGNGEDTDNNGNDFVLQTITNPQNSASALEGPDASPSPSAEPSPSASPDATPSPSPSPIPSLEPSPSPTPEPSIVPSPTPQVTPSPSVSPLPSVSPSPSPSAETSPTPSPSVNPSPSASPNPTPSASPSASPEEEVVFSGRLLRCTITRTPLNIGGITFNMPHLRCERI